MATHYLTDRTTTVETIASLFERDLEKGDVLRVSVPVTALSRDALRRMFADAGLVLLRPWQEDGGEDGRLEVEGTKPYVDKLRVSACMSVPRLGFMDNFGCALDALVPLGIRLRRQGGAFWGQALQNCMELTLVEDDPDVILTLDYDSAFTIGNVAYLLQLMMCHPEVDALAAVQSSRHLSTSLFTKKDAEGNPIGLLNTDLLRPDLMRIGTAHFGLTLIRAEPLSRLPKPWFIHTPSPDGTWRDDSGKIDEDIAFWVAWEKAGYSLCLANRVVCGHLEIMARWPNEEMVAIWQPVRDFMRDGPPQDIWK